MSNLSVVKKMNFNQLDLAKLISKNSNTQVIIIKEEKDLSNYLKKIS